MIQDATCLRFNYSTLKLHLWLTGVESRTAFSLLDWAFQEGLLSSPWPWKSAQLALALRVCSARPGLESLLSSPWPLGPLPTLYRCILLFWWGTCYFSEKPVVSHVSFTRLLLNCLSHPKWSHLCHFSPYQRKRREPEAAKYCGYSSRLFSWDNTLSQMCHSQPNHIWQCLRALFIHPPPGLTYYHWHS
jgi:hypothetical protein